MLIGLSVTGREWGGKQSWMLEIALDLARAGHDLEVLADPGGVFLSRAAAAGLEATAVDVSGEIPPALARRAARWHLALTTGRGDSVWIAGALKALPAAVPHVSIRHSPFPLNVEDRSTAAMLRSLAALILTSDAQRRGEAERLIGLGLLEPARVHVVRSGVRASRWIPPATSLPRGAGLGLPPATRVIGTISRLSWEKGHRVLLQAFARLVCGGADVHMVLVGDGPERSALERFAQELGIAGRVTFTGFRDEVADLLDALDVFVLPSVAGETGPLALKEAMAMARPVIASRVGGIPEVVTDAVTGLLVEPGDASQLFDALATLVAEPERARALGRAARDQVLAEYDWDRTGPALNALLERIAVEAGPSGRLLPGLRWNRSARLRPEAFGGLVFVPETSRVVQLAEADYVAVTALSGAADATPLMARCTASPELVRDLFAAGALRMRAGAGWGGR